jgi:hypothetical protein
MPMLPCEQKHLQVIFTASVGTKPGTLAPPVTLGDMRALGVERLLVSCLNQSLWAHARDIRRPVLLRSGR